MYKIVYFLVSSTNLFTTPVLPYITQWENSLQLKKQVFYLTMLSTDKIICCQQETYTSTELGLNDTDGKTWAEDWSGLSRRENSPAPAGIQTPIAQSSLHPAHYTSYTILTHKL